MFLYKPMVHRMLEALGKLSLMVKAYFPKELQTVLLELSAEVDRLRDEVDELRSKQS